MPDIYVSIGGNDRNNGSSVAQAVRTITRGYQLARPKDRVLVKKLAVGTAVFGPEGPANGGITVKSDVTLEFEDDVVLDQQNQRAYGFMPADGGSVDFRLLHVRIRNCSAAGITMRGKRFEIGYCDIRNIVGNAISINGGSGWGSDGGWIHDNYVENAQQTEDFRSAISVVNPIVYADTPLRTEEPGIPGRPGGGWGFILANNVVVNTGYVGKANGDGNAIIVDLFWNPEGERTGNKTSYTKHTLVKGNICIYSSGCGIKSMNSRYVHVYRNTTYANSRNTWLNLAKNQTNANVWAAEIANYHGSGDNEWRENISFSTRQRGSVFLKAKFNGMGTESRYFREGGYVWDRNLGWNTSGSGRVGYSLGSNPKPTAPEAMASPGIGGYFEADPLFVGPLTLPAESPALGGGLAFYRARFSLQAGSPARGKGQDGGDLGAVPYTTVPPTDPLLEKDTDPVMEILGDTIGTRSDGLPIYPVGATVRFKAGTYKNGPPGSVAHTVEWWNGSAYEAKTATVSGPSSGWYSFNAPSVSKQGGLQIKEVAVKGSVTLTATSNWIDIAPETITNTPPTNSVVPSISGTAAVGAVLSRSVGTWGGRPDPTLVTQWKAGGANIAGATGATYTPVTADIGKTITVGVTGTNSVGSLTVTSAATAAVVDTRPPDDLTGLTRRMEAEEAKSGSQANDITTIFGLISDLDTALKNAVTTLGNRIGAVETETGGLPARVDKLEAGLSDLQLVLDGSSDFEAALYDIRQRIEDVEGVVVRFAANGRLRLYPKA